MGRRTNQRAACLYLALALLMTCLAPSIARAQQVGTVTELKGSAQIQRAGATVAVAQGIPVQLHDRLVTSAKSSATVTLTGGATLSLAENTNLVFDQSVVGGGRSTQLNLFEGGLRSIVPPVVRNETFEIHTPNAVAAVRGTDFDTTYSDGAARPGFGGCQRYTDLRVREGTVAVSNLSNPAGEVDVEAGYETTVPCLLPPLNAGPLGIAGAAGPGGAAGGRSGGGSAGGAAAAAIGFSAPPPGTGSAAPPPPPPPPPPVKVPPE